MELSYVAQRGFIVPENCKVMALCDSIDDSTVGTSVLTNPPPITATPGWTGYNATVSVGATGALRATIVTPGRFALYQNLTTVAGTAYVARGRYSLDGVDVAINLRATNGAGQVDGALGSVARSTTGFMFLTFVATGTTTTLCFIDSDPGSVAGDYFEIDLVECETADKITGVELITSQPPYSATTGFIAHTNCTLSVVTDFIRATSTAAGWYAFYRQATTEIGKRYKATAYVSQNSLPVSVALSAHEATVDVLDTSAAIASTGHLSFDFTARSATTDILIAATATAGGQYFSISGYTLVLVDDDISGNDLGFVVNGTLAKSRTAKNSTVAAYSGFGASAYFSQPYNPALEVGVADWYLGGWFKTALNGSSQVIAVRAYYSGTWGGGGVVQIYIDASNGGVVTLVSDDSYANTDSAVSAAAYTDGEWHWLLVQRVGGSIYTYVDNALASSFVLIDAVSTLNNPSASLIVGRDAYAGSAFGGHLSGFRMGTGSFTAGKRNEHYQYERHLFDAGKAFAVKGNTYTLTSRGTVGRPVFDVTRNIVRSLSGATQTRFHREDEIISVSTAVITGRTELSKWDELTYALRRGGSCSIDIHDEGYTSTYVCDETPEVSRVGVEQYRVTLRGRKI